jgi:hypothetical protein
MVDLFVCEDEDGEEAVLGITIAAVRGRICDVIPQIL